MVADPNCRLIAPLRFAAVNARDHTADLEAEVTADQLSGLVACPVCRGELSLPDSAEQTSCRGCGARYEHLAFAWDLTPPREHLTVAAWKTWEQLQANGVVAYEADPENNLGVGDRADYRQFSRFASLQGFVLDVGCGPQPWPSHFSEHADRCRFVGIDPLVGTEAAGYTRVRGLAEHLPFRDGVFDHVVFATTLDHFVDPSLALDEARRVARPSGSVEVWLGHKRPNAPRPSASPAWYEELRQPSGADDLFHVKRMGDKDARSLFAAADLAIEREETHRVDDYRTNYFYKLRATG
jgi:SAM-dependent methyltransferase